MEYYKSGKLDYYSPEYLSNYVKLKLECEKLNDYETLYTDIAREIDDIMLNNDDEYYLPF